MVKVKDVVHEKCVRKTFSKIGDFIEIPNLLKVQKDSYDWFIKEGLGEVLKDISPIEDYSGNLVLEFFDYYMENKTKYSQKEYLIKNSTILQYGTIVENGEKTISLSSPACVARRGRPEILSTRILARV